MTIVTRARSFLLLGGAVEISSTPIEMLGRETQYRLLRVSHHSVLKMILKKNTKKEPGKCNLSLEERRVEDIMKLDKILILCSHLIQSLSNT